MEITTALLIVAISTAAILNLGRIAGQSPFAISDLVYVNTQAKYQTLLFGVALIVILILYFVNGTNLSKFLAPGSIDAGAGTVPWLGIDEGQTWIKLGILLTVVITLGTAIFVYLQFRHSFEAFNLLVRYLPWILSFSLSNSFSEEIIYRLGIIVPLYGTLDTAYISLISAVAFGAPHLRGMPNGIIGAIMAGFLGWLLAKSVVETHGIAWAWFIHFVQDVVIFSAFVLTTAIKSRNRMNAPASG